MISTPLVGLCPGTFNRQKPSAVRWIVNSPNDCRIGFATALRPLTTPPIRPGALRGMYSKLKLFDSAPVSAEALSRCWTSQRSPPTGRVRV